MDKAKIAKLCNEIEDFACDISQQTMNDIVSAESRMIFDKAKEIAAEITAPPKSNGDRIRHMTDEELAAFIDIYDIEDICRTRCAKTGEARERCMCYGEECKSHILKWFKQEAGEDAGSKTD